MVKPDLQRMGRVVTTNVMSVYILAKPKQQTSEELFQGIGNEIYDIASSKGKAVENVTVGEVDINGDNALEINVLFSGIDVGANILVDILNETSEMNCLGEVIEAVISTDIKETSQKVKGRYGL